jgi:hypothetical protein
MKTLLITVTLALCAASVTAYSPATPWRHVVTSGDKFFFVMDPGNFSDVPGKGVAYRAKRNTVEKLWEVTGWYAPPGDVILSDDGKTLVRVVGGVPYLKDEAMLPHEEVLFFYRKGKLKKTYKVSELIKDLKEGMRPHVFEPKRYWVKETKIAPSEWYRIETNPEGATGMVQHPDVFQLTTIEGAHFIFDLKNGNLLAKGILKKEEPERAEEGDVDPFADEEPEAEQAGTGQPATRPESKSDGSQTPQPEAEGRSR